MVGLIPREEFTCPTTHPLKKCPLHSLPLPYTSRFGYNAHWQSAVGQGQLSVYDLGVGVAGATLCTGKKK